MSDIENKTKEYQWFGLVKYYNKLTKTRYVNAIEKNLVRFNYHEMLVNYDNPISEKNISILQREFTDKGGYKLLLGDSDFCSFFITSE